MPTYGLGAYAVFATPAPLGWWTAELNLAPAPPGPDPKTGLWRPSSELVEPPVFLRPTRAWAVRAATRRGRRWARRDERRAHRERVV